MKNSSQFNNSWKIVSLASEVKFLSGGTPSKSNPMFWNGDIPWVSSGEMTQKRIYSTDLGVTEEGARNGTRLVPKNTVLVVVRGMSLAKEFRVSITKNEMTFNQDLKALIPSKKINSEFLFYYLSSQNHAIRDSASEAAHGTKKLDMPVLEQWPMPLPSLPTQKKIAAVLSAYDDLIENNTRRIALLERMAEELYKEWFVRMRFPGHAQTRFVKGIPEGWEVKKLGEITSVLNRGVSPKYDDESSSLVINQKCIRDGKIDLAFAKFHSSQVQQDKIIRFGDTLINSTGVGTLGRAAIVTEKESGLTVDSHVTICRAKPELANNLYLGYTLRFLQNYFEYMAVGATGQVELLASFLKKTKILLPDFATQSKFGSTTLHLINQQTKLAQANLILKQTRDRLLTRLISGKLSIEDRDIAFPPSMLEDEIVQQAVAQMPAKSNGIIGSGK